jgi:hypothetical protein
MSLMSPIRVLPLCLAGLLVTSAAFSSDRKLTYDLDSQDGKAGSEFRAQCTLLGEELSQRLLAADPNHGLSATVEVKQITTIDHDHWPTCHGIPGCLADGAGFASATQSFCRAKLKSADARLEFVAGETAKLSTKGSSANAVCGPELTTLLADRMNVFAGITESGHKCRVEYVSVVTVN